MLSTLFASCASFALVMGHHWECSPSTSTPILDTLPGTFSLVPVNLHLDDDVVGPTSLNAINFVTLGIPRSTEGGDVSIESFSLTDGCLSGQSGLQISFSPVSGLQTNSWGVTDSSVLKAGEGPEPSTFALDQDGYLVSVTPLIGSDGSYNGDRVKFFACPNEEQDAYGGGEYKVFSNDVPDQEKCLPIYLGVHGSIPAPAPAPPPGRLCEPHEIISPLVTQIWDGQVQAPPTPSPTAPCPAPVPPGSAPSPSTAPYPAFIPGPPSTNSEYYPPGPPLVTQIGDGQVQAPTSKPCLQTSTATLVLPSRGPAPYVSIPVPVPYTPPLPLPAPEPAPPVPAAAVFQGSGTRIALNGFAGRIGLLVLVGIKLIF